MSRTATSARGPWTLPEATLQKEMVRKSLAKPHPRNTLVWDQCAIEAISCGKCNWSAAAFSRPLSRCFPLLYRPPVLRLWCADETSSAQWCICVPSLHLLILRREEARKGRWAGGDQVHPPALSAFRTSSRLGRRNRTCPVTLLAVHAASGHEAGCDGSFRERPHTRLPLYGAVPSAPPHDATPSATLKQEDRLLAALALVADACSPQEESFPQLVPPEQAGVAPSDTVCQTVQGRGKKLVTEDWKPVGSGDSIYRIGKK